MRTNGRSIYVAVLAVFLSLALGARAFDDLLITEFMAANIGPVVDEDGDTSDWIEIHNAGTNMVDLNAWFLTDNPSQLTQWQFPSTNLAPNAYMIVFASGKDRRVPGAPLHTSFSLKATGEYLALVRPDGTNIASAFAPLFPAQVDGVSYGVPMQQAATTLIRTGAVARLRVPSDGSLGGNWTSIAFDDSAWAGVNTGVGFEADGAVSQVVVADSVADWSLSGTQGEKNW